MNTCNVKVDNGGRDFPSDSGIKYIANLTSGNTLVMMDPLVRLHLEQALIHAS